MDRVRRGEASDHLEAPRLNLTSPRVIPPADSVSPHEQYSDPRGVTWATMKFVIIPLTCPRPVSGMSCVVIGSCWITDSKKTCRGARTSRHRGDRRRIYVFGTVLYMMCHPHRWKKGLMGWGAIVVPPLFPPPPRSRCGSREFRMAAPPHPSHPPERVGRVSPNPSIVLSEEEYFRWQCRPCSQLMSEKYYEAIYN